MLGRDYCTKLGNLFLPLIMINRNCPASQYPYCFLVLLSRDTINSHRLPILIYASREPNLAPRAIFSASKRPGHLGVVFLGQLLIFVYRNPTGSPPGHRIFRHFVMPFSEVRE